VAGILFVSSASSYENYLEDLAEYEHNLATCVNSTCFGGRIPYFDLYLRSSIQHAVIGSIMVSIGTILLMMKRPKTTISNEKTPTNFVNWLLTAKRLVYVFLIYGFILGSEISRESGLPGESILYLFNFPVENTIITPVILYFANTARTPINPDQILVVRIIASVAIWGFVGFALYVLGRIWMKDRDPTIRILD